MDQAGRAVVKGKNDRDTIAVGAEKGAFRRIRSIFSRHGNLPGGGMARVAVLGQ